VILLLPISLDSKSWKHRDTFSSGDCRTDDRSGSRYFSVY
jgi:hypothetical protein